ncbi:hypothetical protein CK203_103675 [Vitis vinifera]|uniref:SUZ domain-containing protein n=1 Tax=Vitis vinifera TaxID=29760 RepID=A0A438DND1_VITVI|nr:hypothetical protein CK203_103675 [Vitis vinifera]
MEQDIEKFIHDPTQQQLEFQQLPTSYLRLAAHRVAQHYSLQSMVLLDNNLPDGSDIPVSLPPEDGGVIKVAIKQRPQKRSQNVSCANSHSFKANNSKSVEERKEEYNRARARIFSSSSFSGTGGGKPECEPRMQDTFQHGSVSLPKMEDKPVAGSSDVNICRGLVDSSTSSNRSARSRAEKEPIGRYKPNNRVAIFRDREIDRKDPDYDRSYDRYLQRFDPGFGFNGGPYTIQPMYTPAVNYNTEFPQLGSAHRPQISTEHQPRPLPQHLSGPWPATINSYRNWYPCQRPGMPFIHPHEHVHQPFSQSHQQQPDTSFGLARPRSAGIENRGGLE